MTIKDIAQLSGCGVATVSRVLNNHPDVSEETRQRVLAVVAEQGFEPNRNARRLKQQAGTGISIIVRGKHNILFADLVERLQSALRGAERDTSIHFLDEEDDEVAYACRLCRERKPPGIIFLGGDLSHFQAQFQCVSTPSLLLTNCARELGFPNLSSLTTDDEAAAYAAIAFLAGRGHQAIGVLGSWQRSQIGCRRMRGCRRACRDLGLDFDPAVQGEACRYSLSGGYEAAKALLERCPNLTALFAASDVIALGAVRAIQDMGGRVPEDVSVIGFDGIAFTNYVNPRLATVRQDIQYMARRGVEVLLGSMEGGAPFHETVPFRLETGESVAQV